MSDSSAAPAAIHTRSLTLEARSDGAGVITLQGEVLDLRKRGLMAVPGALQLPGVIHRMEIDARIDTAERRIASVATRQPVVAFEASERSAGESCRDSAPALHALAGVRIDGGFLRRLTAAYGGPRGCTHLLTLTRLLASAATRVLDRELALGSPARAQGERIFRRVLIVDGFEHPDRRLEVAAQMSDVHQQAEAAVGAGLWDRLAAQTEVRASVIVDLLATTMHALRAEERHRTPADLDATFRDRSAELADLVGKPLMSGFGPALVQRFAGRPEDAPLLDVLLNLAPGFTQCMGALMEGVLRSGLAGSAVGVGPGPDSCFMWRADGPLQRLITAARSPQEPATSASRK